MKHNASFYIMLLTITCFTLQAQTDSPKWKFGIGGGANSLWSKKPNDIAYNFGIVLGYKKYENKQVNNRFGWQFHTSVSYRAAKPLFLLTGLRFTKVHFTNYREIESKSIAFVFGNSLTQWDTIRINDVFADIPLGLRVQLSLNIQRLKTPLKFFFDMGVNAALPLTNNSSYIQRDSNGNNFKHQLKLANGVNTFFGVGHISENWDIALRWSLLSHENDDVNTYEVLMFRLILSYYF